MKKRILWLTFAIVFGIVGNAVYGHIRRPYQFIDQAFEQMRGKGGSEHSETYRLDSGESFTVILEHSCCSGAGFDAVAIRTSAGDEFSALKNYCGIEGFSGYSIASKMKTLVRLKSYLKAQGYKEH
jgi:hypothetical protein